jgi:hypothetical protein
MTYAVRWRFCAVQENHLVSLRAVRAQPGAVSVGEVILLAERLAAARSRPRDPSRADQSGRLEPDRRLDACPRFDPLVVDAFVPSMERMLIDTSCL